MIDAQDRTRKTSPLVAAARAFLFAGLFASYGSAAAPEMSDVTIGDAVEDQLFVYQAVPAHAIDATANDGSGSRGGAPS